MAKAIKHWMERANNLQKKKREENLRYLYSKIAMEKVETIWSEYDGELTKEELVEEMIQLLIKEQ